MLDVGCGPGRHASELARRGMLVHGVDISARFVELARRDAPEGATFERLDARDLRFEQEFDAAICLCQGAFGLMVDERDDDAVVAGIAKALVPGGVLALSAFNAYFAVKYHVDATFDAATGVAHERTEVRNEAGEAIETDLWTRCYTPSRAALDPRPPRPRRRPDQQRRARRVRVGAADRGVPRVPCHCTPGLKFCLRAVTRRVSCTPRRMWQSTCVTREVTQGLRAVVARSR